MKQVIAAFPTVGIAIFTALYVVSSLLYPGGSQVDLNSEGFDWVNNYWCNLMDEKGMNGEHNPAKPYAMVAMVILCSSLMIFFIKYANMYSKHKKWNRVIKVSGVISMSFAVLIFTQHHDVMITISSVFGLFTIVGIIREVYRGSMIKYQVTGVLCLLLLGLNNYIYYSGNLLLALPLLQKITFAMVLLWVVGLNIKMIQPKAD